MFQGDGGFASLPSEETEQGRRAALAKSSEAMMDMEPEYLRKWLTVSWPDEGDQSAFDYVDIMADLIYHKGRGFYRAFSQAKRCVII